MLMKAQFGAGTALWCLLALNSAGEPGSAAEESSSTGTIAGRVRYVADPQQPWLYQRYYVADKKAGFLAETVVAAEAKRPSEDRPRREPVTHVMDQKDFRFVPETMAICRGDRVKFTNSDVVVHNVLSFDLEEFNVNTPPGEPHTQTFSRAGGASRPVRIGCVYHSTMRAWIYVFDHAHFAVTAADGKFRIENVPPGRYELVAVHPAGALRRTIEVEVRAGETAEIDVSLSPAHLTTRKPQ